MRRSVRPFLPTAVLLPLFGATLGIDGGAIFQIMATENLGLSPRAIGLAFGLGTLSVPLQLYAARLPLHQAKRNIQLFLTIVALQVWILAGLLLAGASGRFTVVALAVTITAEVALSVLFATAWQPLVSVHLTSLERQSISSSWRAAALAMLAAAALLFAALSTNGRGLFLIITGLLALLCAAKLDRLPQQETPASPPAEPDRNPPNELIPSPDLVGSQRSLHKILIAAACLNVAALPLWLIYLHEVLWPSVNLGLIALLQTGASLIAFLAWRPTEDPLAHRLRIASAVGLISALLIPFGQSPDSSRTHQLLIIGATIGLSCSLTTSRIAMIELAHRTFDSNNAVRSFTVLDVVASTSLQLGLLASGALIALSQNNRWIIDPYQGFVIAGSGAACFAIYHLCRLESSN